jgi:hypothetical protein
VHRAAPCRSVPVTSTLELMKASRRKLIIAACGTLLLGLVLGVVLWPYVALAEEEKVLEAFCRRIPARTSLPEIKQMAASVPGMVARPYDEDPKNLRVKFKRCTCIVLLQPSGTQLGATWCNL